VVLIGVGAPPDADLAQQAGLPYSGGIVVDDSARTADPDVYAIGDVTWRPMPLYGRMFRLESVANALEQAKHAAGAIVGRPAPPPEVTWNWSDQYDIKYQFAGVPFDADQVLVRGDPRQARFGVFHLKGDVIQAVEAVNAPAEFMGGKMLIGQKRPVSLARLADVSVSMKEVAA
jgi:3-phenylpropionate/trans-cinnamate dioxygenase ferredoxin reductase subunit